MAPPATTTACPHCGRSGGPRWDGAAAVCAGCGRPWPAPTADGSEAPTRYAPDAPPVRAAARAAPTLVVGAGGSSAGAGFSLPPPSAKTGDTVGHFVLMGELGRGGMGAVYEAEDTVLRRRVAIKLLPPAMLDEGPRAVERFLQEARAAAALEHPNIVAVHQVGHDAGRHYIAMQLVRGGSAEAAIRTRGALPAGEAGRIIADAARGLAAAHSRGVIHRDIKPGNIMLGADGIARLTDFGLAKVAGGGAIGLTQTGMIIGTPQYMSPEQCEGLALDGRSDIYSLGATYACLLTGRPPFSAELPVQLMFAHCHVALEDPPGLGTTIPDACWRVVRRAMAKRPAERYQTADAMLADLEAALADSPPAAGLPGRTVAAGSAGRRGGRAALKWIAALLVLGGIGAGVYVAVEHHVFPPRTTSTEPDGVGGGGGAGVPAPPDEGGSASGTIDRLVGPGPGSKPAKKTGEATAVEPERDRVPFPAARAARLQADWARHLKTGPEIGNSIGMRFRLIPPGAFAAGSPADEPGHEPHEARREAVIDRPFYLAAHEVTNAEFRKVFTDFPARPGDEDDGPAVGIFANAENFCRKLSELPQERAAGRRYRLPTGVEWEWACRAGTAGAFHGPAAQTAWTKADVAPGRLRPMPVAGKQANAWGLFDMHGNAAEWVADFPVDFPGRRIYRSGMWTAEPERCRSAATRSVDPDNGPHLRATGFRVLCEIR